jgi:monofunctional glycosyltransferase
MAKFGKWQDGPKAAALLKSLWEKAFLLVSRGFILLFGAAFILSLLYMMVPPPISNYMILKSFSGNGLDYRYVPLARISKHLPRAVVAAEDTRFCEHDAVEWSALMASVQDVLSGDRDRPAGASTITMQVARNLFLWPGRSYLRKALEIPLAIWIDQVWSKRRILEIYLNIAEFGPGIYGAEAAAWYHFKKPAAELTGREALRLAAVLPNPIKRIAANPSAGVVRYAARIQGRVAGTEPFFDCLGLKDR